MSLAVRAVVRPQRSHSHYSSTPECCKSFVLEEKGMIADEGSQPQIINVPKWLSYSNGIE